MSAEQLSERTLLLERLTQAGWHGNSINQAFDDGDYVPYEIAMLLSGKRARLRIDVHCKDKQLFLYIFSDDSRHLELMFQYDGILEPLLEKIITIQDEISEVNYRSYTRQLIDVCPECYTFTENGQKARVVKSTESST